MVMLRQRVMLLKTGSNIEKLINEYLAQMTKSQEYFNLAWNIYLDSPEETKALEEKIQRLTEVESHADKLQKNVESYLYEKTLIPDLRADVALLVELSDRLLSLHKGIATHMQIELPFFPKETHNSIKNILKYITATVDHLVLLLNSFFGDMERVNDQYTKVNLYEKETNIACLALRKMIFDMKGLDLSQKMHARYFIDRLDFIANEAENVADRATIFALKRAI